MWNELMEMSPKDARAATQKMADDLASVRATIARLVASFDEPDHDHLCEAEMPCFCAKRALEAIHPDPAKSRQDAADMELGRLVRSMRYGWELSRHDVDHWTVLHEDEYDDWPDVRGTTPEAALRAAIGVGH